GQTPAPPAPRASKATRQARPRCSEVGRNRPNGRSEGNRPTSRIVLMRRTREVGVGSGVTPSEDILPIALIDEAAARAVAVCGTGFLIADGLIVTAWHCVREPLKPGQRYVVCRKRRPDVYDPFP